MSMQKQSSRISPHQVSSSQCHHVSSREYVLNHPMLYTMCSFGRWRDLESEPRVRWKNRIPCIPYLPRSKYDVDLVTSITPREKHNFAYLLYQYNYLVCHYEIRPHHVRSFVDEQLRKFMDCASRLDRYLLQSGMQHNTSPNIRLTQVWLQ